MTDKLTQLIKEYESRHKALVAEFNQKYESIMRELINENHREEAQAGLI